MGQEMDAVSAGDANRKFTQPLGGAVSTVLMLVLAVVVLGVALAPANHGASFFGFGSGPACANVSLNGIAVTGNGPTLANIRPHADASTGPQVMICANRPTTGQQALATLTQAPTAILGLAILVLLWQLLRTIRTTGPFAVLVARRLRFLGWFTLIGSLVATACESLGQSAFASTVVTDRVPVLANLTGAETNSIVLPILIACGLLTLARIIRRGAQMGDDLAGTV